VYEDMNAGYLYRVYRSQSGLLARKAVQPGAGSAGGVTTIAINKSSAPTPGRFGKTAHYLERLVPRIRS
jgi:hypothetical protein